MKKHLSQLVRFVSRAVYTFLVKRKLKRCGKRLCVNHFSSFHGDVSVGDYCNFNGMRIEGYGKVIIGNYFHSGTECIIITSNHNYEGGNPVR